MAESDTRKCPACRVDMRIVLERGAEIDVCDRCHGIWLDRGELSTLLSLKRGWNPLAAKSGGETDEHALKCPSCDASQFRLVSHHDNEIRVCETCSGTFVDSKTLDRLDPTASAPPTKERFQSFNINASVVEGLIELLAFFAMP